MTDEQTNDGEFVEINMSPPPADDETTPPPPPADETTPAGDEGEKPKADEAADGDKGGEDDKPGDENADPLRDEKGRYRGGAAGRINELTRARREAERQAEYWKGIATRNGAGSGDDAAPKSKPTPDDFEDYGDYVEALTDWKVADRAHKEASTQADNAVQTVEQHRAAEWGAKIGAAKATIADFDAVMDKADMPTKQHVADAIMDADRGPELLYHLAQHPDVVERLNEMSPNRAAIELGRIEATLEAPAAPPKPRETQQSKAPAPITPVAPGSSTAKDPGKMSQDEYNKWRKEQLAR